MRAAGFSRQFTVVMATERSTASLMAMIAACTTINQSINQSIAEIRSQLTHYAPESHFLITNSFIVLLIELPFCINIFKRYSY